MTAINSISYWEKESLQKNYDCIIVGAGFVGLSAAIYLKQGNPDWDILILERGVISYGASTRNAGFTCFGTIGELEEDRSSMTIDSIVNIVKQRWEGLRNLNSLVPMEEMEYENLGGIELFDNESSFQSAANQISFWNNILKNIIGENVFEIIDQPMKGFYSKAIFNKYEGQLNPKRAIDALYRLCNENNIAILNGITVDSWNSDNEIITIKTDCRIDFTCKRLSLATNAFTNTLLPQVSVVPARNQVLITKEIKSHWKGCYHFNKGYIYFRSVGNRILLGGARYLSEEENTAEYGNTATIQEFLTSFLEQRIMNDEDVEIDHWWSGILGIGEKKTPIISRYADQIYLAVRLGGMGVAIGTSVGKQLAELIVNE